VQLRFVKPEILPRKLRPDWGSSLHFCPGSLLPFTTAISLWHLAFVIFISDFCVDDLQSSEALGSPCSLVRQLRAPMDVRREATTPRQMYAYVNFQGTVAAHESTYDGSNGRVLVEPATLRLLYISISRTRPLVRIPNFSSRHSLPRVWKSAPPGQISIEVTCFRKCGGVANIQLTGSQITRSNSTVHLIIAL
jgi:hypothetical protein